MPHAQSGMISVYLPFLTFVFRNGDMHVHSCAARYGRPLATPSNKVQISLLHSAEHNVYVDQFNVKCNFYNDGITFVSK